MFFECNVIYLELAFQTCIIQGFFKLWSIQNFGQDLQIYKRGLNQFVRAFIQTPNFCVLHNNVLTTIVLTPRLSTQTLPSLNIYSIKFAFRFYVNCMVF